MSNDESKVERHAGIDMVPIGESFEMNWGPDDGDLGSLPPTVAQEGLARPTLTAWR
jgi:hypothetical protein